MLNQTLLKKIFSIPGFFRYAEYLSHTTGYRTKNFPGGQKGN
jgi:hypothetical protein